jgi:hypothetical protein
MVSQHCSNWCLLSVQNMPVRATETAAVPIDNTRSQNRAVCMLTNYRLDNWRFGVWALSGEVFSVFHGIQTSSGTHPTSYSLGIGGSYPRGEVTGVWSQSLSSNYVRPLSHVSLWQSVRLVKHRVSLTLWFMLTLAVEKWSKLVWAVMLLMYLGGLQFESSLQLICPDWRLGFFQTP